MDDTEGIKHRLKRNALWRLIDSVAEVESSFDWVALEDESQLAGEEVDDLEDHETREDLAHRVGLWDDSFVEEENRHLDQSYRPSVSNQVEIDELEAVVELLRSNIPDVVADTAIYQKTKL